MAHVAQARKDNELPNCTWTKIAGKFSDRCFSKGNFEIDVVFALEVNLHKIILNHLEFSMIFKKTKKNQKYSYQT